MDLQPFIETLRSKLSLAEVIGEHVLLRKRGVNYSGLCPFHAEKTPSFSVNEQKGVFYCFGCQKGGDLIKFVQEFQGISFIEALKVLAAKAQLPLPPGLGGDGGGGGERQTEKEIERHLLLKLNRFAAQFYHDQLWRPEGEVALGYLRGRGLSDETIRRAFLGWASPSWSALYEFLLARKAPLVQAESLGLIRPKPKDAQGRGHYDLFRSRVLFPVQDRRGQVLGFGGRLVDVPGGSGTPGVEGPKYLNSPESMVFQKSDCVYGIQFAEKFIRQRNAVLIVEGYMDCLALQQAGFEHTVATLGTSLSVKHIKGLSRLADTLFFVYDGDKAGRAAQQKALELCLPHLPSGVMARGVSVPEGLDPDEWVRCPGGIEQLSRALETAPTLLDGFILAKKSATGRGVQERAQSLEEILPWVAYIDSENARWIYLQDLSVFFQVPEEALRQQVESHRARLGRKNMTEAGRGAVVLSKNSRAAGGESSWRERRSHGEKSGSGASWGGASGSSWGGPSRRSGFSRPSRGPEPIHRGPSFDQQMLEIALQFPRQVAVVSQETWEEYLDALDQKPPSALASFLLQFHRSVRGADSTENPAFWASLIDQIQDPELKALVIRCWSQKQSIQSLGVSGADGRSENKSENKSEDGDVIWFDLLRRLKERLKDRKREELKSRIRQAELHGELELTTKLMQEFKALMVSDLNDENRDDRAKREGSSA